jgi:glutaredoxin 3
MDQKRIVIYAKHRSPYCWRAKRLFRRKGYDFEVIEVSSGGLPSGLAARPAHTARRRTVPQVFVDGRLVGGLNVVRALDSSGDVDRLVRGEV